MSDLDTVFSDDWAEDHRSGIVAIVGRPNVGKSTLINSILGQKIAIVTPKPQTTRKQQLGIYTVKAGQILFVDTPGIHKPHHKLGEYMVDEAENALYDADIILWIVDASTPPHLEDKHIAEIFGTRAKVTPIVLALNKIDLVSGQNSFVEEYKSLAHYHSTAEISALNNTGVAELAQNLLIMLPFGPRYYPADQLSEVNMRFIATEIIRERIILHTEQEIPYSVAVEVDSYREGDERTTISAIIHVERDSQKGIIIGKGGQMIKKIGTEARQELMKMLDVSVHLDLRVKVLKDWRSNDRLMKLMGYKHVKPDEE